MYNSSNLFHTGARQLVSFSEASMILVSCIISVSNSVGVWNPYVAFVISSHSAKWARAPRCPRAAEAESTSSSVFLALPF